MRDIKFTFDPENIEIGDKMHHKRIILSYSNLEELEEFLNVLKAIAEDTGIEVEDASDEYLFGKDY